MNEQRRLNEGPAAAKPIANTRALIVDDDENIRKMLSLALDRIGFEVLEAGNGLQAYEMLLDMHFDLVVTDLQMPMMDGMALIEKLKHHSPETPVVLVTGQWPGLIDQHEGSGTSAVCAVLHKPFPMAELQRAARNALDAFARHGTTRKGEQHEPHR